jgi:hypothetical protein
MNYIEQLKSTTKLPIVQQVKWWEKLKRFLLESFDEMFADF